MKGNYVSISLIFLLVLLVSGCTRDESFEQRKCEDYAIVMVPDKITLIEEDPAAVYPASILSYSGKKFWNDGKGLDKEYYAFRKGHLEGQNAKYYYYESPVEGFVYSSENFILEDGTILGRRLFAIKPTVKEITGAEEENPFIGGIQLNMTMKLFEIVEPNFVYCKWVTEDGRVIE